MKIRKMTLDDLNEVISLDQICFLSPWGESQFLYELNENPFSTILVCEHDEKIVFQSSGNRCDRIAYRSDHT